MPAIATITNGSNPLPLQKTIESFLSNCSTRPLVWAIFDNGTTGELYTYIRRLPRIPGVLWIKERSDIDIGVGAGINRLNNLIRNEEFVLFLEHDWVHLPEQISGVSPTWLDETIAYMQQEQIDFVHLRRYLNDDESRFHGWTDDVLKNAKATDSTFIPYSNLRYTNNPHVRRSSALFEKGVLPLREFFDHDGVPLEHKWHRVWSQAEASAPPIKNAAIHRWGMFAHVMPNIQTTPACGCGSYSHGASTCKYGFFEWNTRYCGLCDQSKDWTDLYKHDQRWLNVFHHLSANYQEERTKITPQVSDSFIPMSLPVNFLRNQAAENDYKNSILIPTKGSPDILSDCLNNLIETCKVNDEIIVAVHQSGMTYNEPKHQYGWRVRFIDIDYPSCVSHLWNQLILQSSRPHVFIMNHKARPTAEDFAKSIEIYNQGYGMVGLHRFCFFFFNKYLINQVGWFDERFIDSAWEDFDFVRRMREKDIGYYETDIVKVLKLPKLWVGESSKEFFYRKWTDFYCTTRSLPEEGLYERERQNYRIYRTHIPYKKYRESKIVPYNWYTPCFDPDGTPFTPQFVDNSVNDDPHKWSPTSRTPPTRGGDCSSHL